MSSPQDQNLTKISKIDRIHRTDLISVGEVLYKKGGSCGPRIQTRYELIVLFSGQAEIEVDGVVHFLEAGRVALLRPRHHEMLSFSKSSPSRQAWCIMRPELLPAGLASRLGTLPFSTRSTERFRALVEMALDFPVPLSTAGKLFLEQLVVSIFYEFYHAVETEAQQATLQPAAVRKSIEFIESNYGSSLNLNDIARAMNVTPHHLIKLFQKHIQDTPMHFLWHLRTQRGAELLRTTGLNVSEVAFRTGFQSPFHFSRMFKDHFQISPKEFRRKLWANSDANDGSLDIAPKSRRKPRRGGA